MGKLRAWLRSRNTEEESVTRLLIKGYLFLTVLCLVLLLMPFFQKQSISLIDQLFYAVSIVSTTGLVPTDFGASYNFGGQLVALFFIQLGGIGYMALGSFVILNHFERLPSLSIRLLRLEFNLPERYPLRQFIYAIFIFTLLIESIGALLLYIGFSQIGIEQPIWNAIFHSISAFCTAGFSLFSDSFTGFREVPLIFNTTIALSLLGSIGFIVLLDFVLFFIRKRTSITLTSKIILLSTFLLWIGGAVFLFLSENNIALSGWNGFKGCLFQSMTAHTTVGFNSLPIGDFSTGTLFVLIILMVVGASPSGTGGGVKTTSITALFAVLKSVLKRRKKVTFLNRVLPPRNIFLAISSMLFYLILLSIGLWILLLTDGDQHSFQFLLFECASALSTVGISSGITGDLSFFGKLLIIVLMFVGRVGVLTFGLALLHGEPLMTDKIKEEDIAI